MPPRPNEQNSLTKQLKLGYNSHTVSNICRRTDPIHPNPSPVPIEQQDNPSHYRGALRVWAEAALQESGYRPAAHHLYLISELEKLAAGEFDRLMILMPPGSAKSTYTSLLFPVWWFLRHPRSTVICASHSLGLARSFGRRARDLVQEHAGQLGFAIKPGHRAAESWSTTDGGEYLAIGVRGAMIGRRADLIIIDDPVKSHADADSKRQREFLWEWYKSDVSTRLKPGGRVALVMTRWHKDDLGGLLEATAGDGWRVLRLPALAEPGDPLGRGPGEPLWPEWEGLEALARRRALIGDRAWSALYQQKPQGPGGSLFNTAAITETEAAEPDNAVIRGWDFAATAKDDGNEPDWTAGVKLWRAGDQRWVVLDVVRIRGSALDVEDLLLKTAAKDGRKVTIALPQDPGQAGKFQASWFTGRLSGFHVVASRESGPKTERARYVASQVEAGHVAVVRAPWNRAFLEELQDFPNGSKDDQVDALSRAFNTLSTLQPRAVGARVHHMVR
jgi:predicted phage terminase large subunit-like protein